MYEMFCGKVPFGDDLDDPYLVQDLIINNQLEYPTALKAKLPAKALIDRLLDKIPASRGTPLALKKMKWFRNVKWAEYLMRNVSAPHIPKLEHLSETVIEIPF